METPDEFLGSNDRILHNLAVKGRRNKRMRLVCGGGGGVGGDVTSSSSCGGDVGGRGEEFAATSSVSGEIIDDHHDHEIISTEEEEDMANCLILLAQGDCRHRRRSQILEQGLKIERISTKRFNFDHMGKAGFYVYECKTCNRTFPSFQALGGHRASHKKPKSITAVAAAPIAVEEPEEPQFNKVATSTPVVATTVQIPTRTVVATAMNFQTHKGGKIHECSICGLEFTSGQALGGHMRRHRATTASSAQQVVAAANTEDNHNHHHHQNHRNSSTAETMKQRNNILELDLNLPAPEEDVRETKFQFTATPQTIVFSAPTLVDCHY